MDKIILNTILDIDQVNENSICKHFPDNRDFNLLNTKNSSSLIIFPEKKWQIPLNTLRINVINSISIHMFHAIF